MIETRGRQQAFAAAQKGKTMAAAQNGDRVRVHYTGKLNDGTVFDTSREGDPIEFAIGSQMVIAGFENAVLGMEPGPATGLVRDYLEPFKDELLPGALDGYDGLIVYPAAFGLVS